MSQLYYVVAIIAGLCVAIQAGVNSHLQTVVKSPIVSGLISFLVGTAALLIYILISNPRSLTAMANVTQVSPWQLTGGILGAFYICSIIIGAPKIGAASMIGFAVASQLIFSVIFDHFGWVGFPVRTITWERVIGVALLIGGLFLIRK